MTRNCLKISSPNPNQNTIFWGGLTPEHLEIIPKNIYKMTGSHSKWSRHKSADFSTSLRIKTCCHSFILFPMPPSANPGLSMGNFGIAWATCMISKCCHNKNIQKRWPQPVNPPWNWWFEPASAILLRSLILLPMPPNASPGLSMGHFGTVWATCMISKCCHYKMAGLNLSTHHEIGDWASTCHPFGLKLPG